VHEPTDTPEPELRVEDRGGGVRWLTLHRPAARNALSLSLLDALRAGLADAEAEPGVRVLVLAAAGPAFCAGHDLREIRARRGDTDGGVAFFEMLMASCSEVMQAIVHHRVPVIARVHGVATAAGTQLVASCDLAVAADDARFATPGVDIGLFCSTPMVALSRDVHPKHAMAMLLTGDLVDAGHAERIGLINRSTSPDRLDEEVTALAERIAAKSSFTLRIGKEAFYRQRELPLDDAYRYASEVMVANLLAEDADEGIGAFLDKRTPEWLDR
jgi:enoyl-CoA hydratase/carnithine racemase